MADSIYIIRHFDPLMDDFFDVAAFHTFEAAEKKLDEHGFIRDDVGFYNLDPARAHKCSQGKILCAENDCPIYKKWLKELPDLYPCDDYEHMADDTDFYSFYEIKEIEISG